MTTYKHIVQVHPVELGEPNLYKVISEEEFDTKEEAIKSVDDYNTEYKGVRFGNKHPYRKAVYLGRVNDESGELE
jgi:hypothetical protein